jgi:hypothetical protein
MVSDASFFVCWTALLQVFSDLSGPVAGGLSGSLEEAALAVIERFKHPGARGIGARALIFIDAFERFYDVSAAPLRRLFARVAREARVNVVTSMRSDALPLLTDHDRDVGPLATPINIQPIDEDTLPDLIV